MPLVTSVLRTTANALDIAGSIVPFVGAAGVIVREINDSCEKIIVHKRKARRMAMKCVELEAILNEHNRDRVGTEMQAKIDEATAYITHTLFRQSHNDAPSAESTRESEIEFRKYHKPTGFFSMELQSLRQTSDGDQLMISDVRSHSPPPLPTDSQRYLEQQREVVQKGLAHLHQLTGIPPSIKLLNGEVKRIGELAIAGGTYSDIWEGSWLNDKKA
ncbi:hypothetical protein C0991_000867 [Blastosporella zonata]|nr:hypothetical protein C0991_000867 [Blastosporella zonata]